jgi:hypothetical protein
MRRKDKFIRIAILFAIPLLLSGCFRARSLERIAEEIAWQYPDADFEREFSVSLGSMSLGLARFGAGFFEEGREAREYIRGVKRVQIAVYKVKHLYGIDDAKIPSGLSELLEDDEWEVMVKTSDPKERVWILYREDGDAIRDIHLTVLSDDELVLLRVSGHINDILDKAIEDHGDLTTMIHDARH